ncbi:hypothetical protein H7E67_19225 [Clostridium gasigenes]|nr:hypothetical protein [Clostridium gasigenes]
MRTKYRYKILNKNIYDRGYFGATVERVIEQIIKIKN